MYTICFRIAGTAALPIDGFFEWKDIYSTGKDKQPYAIAMKSGEPFALAAIWEMWRDPKTEERIRTFCVLTCEPNEMMATIHNRMLVIWVLPTIVDSSWMRTRETC